MANVMSIHSPIVSGAAIIDCTGGHDTGGVSGPVLGVVCTGRVVGTVEDDGSNGSVNAIALFCTYTCSFSLTQGDAEIKINVAIGY